MAKAPRLEEMHGVAVGITVCLTDNSVSSTNLYKPTIKRTMYSYKYKLESVS